MTSLHENLISPNLPENFERDKKVGHGSTEMSENKGCYSKYFNSLLKLL